MAFGGGIRALWTLFLVSTKNSNVFGYEVLKHLRVDLLTSSLSYDALNSRAQMCTEMLKRDCVSKSLFPDTEAALLYFVKVSLFYKKSLDSEQHI